MSVKKSTFFLGIFVILLPFLGLPTFWKSFFIVLSGTILTLASVRFEISRKEEENSSEKNEILEFHEEVVVLEKIPEPALHQINYQENGSEIKKSIKKRVSKAVSKRKHEKVS
jgi:hypothetical protein